MSENIQTNIVGDIERYIQIGCVYGNVYFQNDKVFPEILTDSYPKPVLKNIISRESELAEFHEMVKCQKIVVITGFGGTGKTTFASLYREKHINDYKHLIWINCISNKKSEQKNYIIDKLFYNRKLLDNLGIDFKDPDNTTDEFYIDMFNITINRLNEIKEYSLIVIDNANNEFDQNEIYNKLSSFNENWKILITSRENLSLHFETYNLKFLSQEQARNLFYLYYKRESNNFLIDEITQIVGLHTLSIELLSKTVQANRSLNLNKIIKLLHDNGLNIPKAEAVKIKTTFDKVEVNTYIFDCLKAAFAMVTKLDETARKCLIYFSVLPSIYISYDELIDLLMVSNENKSQFNEDLNYLRDKGLINETDDGSFTCHQVLQEIVRNDFNPTVEDCKALIDSISLKLEYDPASNPIEKVRYLPFAESILYNIKEENEKIASLAHNMNDVYDSIGEYKKAIECELKAIKIRERLCADSLELAQSYNDIAVSYRRENNLKESLIYHRKALKLRRKLFGDKHPDLAESYMNIATVYYENNTRRAIKLYNIALSLLDIATAENIELLVKKYNIYDGLGMCFLLIGEYVEAQKFIEYSLKIQREIHKNETHPDIISSMKNLGAVLSHQHKHSDAKVIFKKVLELQISIYKNDHPFVLDTAQILNKYSQVN